MLDCSALYTINLVCHIAMRAQIVQTLTQQSAPATSGRVLSRNFPVLQLQLADVAASQQVEFRYSTHLFNITTYTMSYYYKFICI